MRTLRGTLVVALLCGGCFHTDYFVAGTTPVEEAHVDWRNRLLLGIVDLDPDVNLREVCPQGVSRIEEEMEFLNVIVALFTAGIYTTTTVEVWCQAPQPLPPRPPEPEPEPEPLTPPDAGVPVDAGDPMLEPPPPPS